jgi:hypothetical protein
MIRRAQWAVKLETWQPALSALDALSGQKNKSPFTTVMHPFPSTPSLTAAIGCAILFDIAFIPAYNSHKGPVSV